MDKKQYEYLVDFGTWVIVAESENAARKEAERMLKAGDHPPIDQIILGGEYAE